MSDLADQFIHAVHEREIERLQRELEARDKEIATLQAEKKLLIMDRDKANVAAAKWQKLAMESRGLQRTGLCVTQVGGETELEALAKQIFVQHAIQFSSNTADAFVHAENFLARRNLRREQKEVLDVK